MTFIFDENLPPTLARGLHEFGEPAQHSTVHFAKGTKDETLLEFIGTKGFVLVTRDDRVRYNPLEISAIRRHKVGAFILQGKSLSGWDLVRQVVRNWHRMKELAAKEHRPFVYQIPSRGNAIRRLV